MPFSTSRPTLVRGRMLTPDWIAIACLIVSMLSNSIAVSGLTPRCLSERSMALRIARFFSKAMNFSSPRSFAMTSFFFASACDR